MKRLALLAVIAVAAAGCAGCAGNLSFRTDKRLHWDGPKQRALVKAPLTLAWHFDGTPPATYAVFVDRAPIKPGQTLRSVGANDQSCKSDPTCPNAAYLAQRQVYTTQNPSLLLDQVLPLANNRDGTQLHQATVVLLDPTGHRKGEAAWTREFKMKRVSA